MKKRILVVDNSQFLLQAMTDILEKHGHEVVTAVDGLYALKLLEHYQPDIMFVDMVMPKITGDKLCRVVRTIERLQHVFIVIISGIAVEQDINYIEFGADACIAKGPIKEMAKHIIGIIGQSESSVGKRKLNYILGKEGVYEREVTRELLLSRKHFEITLDNISEGFIELTEKGEIILANLAAVQLFNTQEEKLLSKMFVNLFSGDNKQRILTCIENLVQSPLVCGEDESIVFNNKQLKLTFVRFHDQDEKSIIVLTNDITKRKEAEHELHVYRNSLEKMVTKRTTELLESNKKLQQEVVERQRTETEREKLEKQLQQSQKMEAIGTLASGIAHDFNNILSAIMGYAELSLIEAGTNAPVQRGLMEICNATNRASKLIKQILTFSRQDNNQFNLVRFTPIFKEALKLLRASLPATIEIKQYVDSQCTSAYLMAELTQMHQIIMNLGANAYHAMRDNGGILKVRLSVSTFSSDDDKIKELELVPGQYLRLQVRDTGHGMSPEVAKRIFEPYFTTKQRGEGTGMGLSMVHGIVKRHGGGIAVASSLGQGTTFTVFLPIAEFGSRTEKVIISETCTEGNEHILFVDDEEMIALMQKELLENLGYKVTVLTSSEEALELFMEKPDDFDLMITDMTMPKITGAVLTQKILEIRPDLPVIICTGFSEIFDEQKANELGVKGYLIKPVVLKKMNRAIRKALGE